MFQRSRSGSRLALTAATVIALLILSTGSVAADTGGPVGDATFTQNGTGADAGMSDCASNGDGTTSCSEVWVSVFAGRMSDNVSGVTHANQVCASFVAYTYFDETGEIVGEPNFESGCEVDLPRGTLAFGSKLSSASLATTTVTVARMVCDEFECVPGASRDVTVAGTWTGIGPIMYSKWRSVGDDGTCRYGDSGKGHSREASFSGTVDGVSLGDDAYAFLQDGRFTFRSRCSEV